MPIHFGNTFCTPCRSASLAPDSDVYCWNRCLRRKGNDGTRLRPEDFPGPDADSLEPTRRNMSDIMENIEGSSISEEDSITATFQYKRLNQSPFSAVPLLNLGVLSQEPSRALETDSLPRYAYTVFPSGNSIPECQHIETDYGAPFKKRLRVEINEGYIQGPEHHEHAETLTLMKALISERKAVRKLRKDLEQEKCASETAVNEAMAMIRCLHEVKSAALTEARQYKVASEGREAYSREAIALLKETLAAMENEGNALQDRIANYRIMLFRLISQQYSQCERSENEHKLLMSEGSNLASLFLQYENETRYSTETQTPKMVKDQVSGDTTRWHYHLSNASLRKQYLENHYSKGCTSDPESNKFSEGQHLDDTSKLILARIAYLEQCLKHNHGKTSACYCKFCQDTEMSLDEYKEMKFEEQDANEIATWNSQALGTCPTAIQTTLEGSVYQNLRNTEICDDHFQRRDCGVPVNIGAMDFVPHELKFRSSKLENDDTSEPIFQLRGNAERVVHDLDELHYGHGNCEVHPKVEIRDIMISRTIEVSSIKPIHGRSLSSVKDFLPHKCSVQCGSSNEERVSNFKSRVQALEGERAFMKVAMSSLKEENIELKLLQHIAQELQELKGDVWNTKEKRPANCAPSSFLSFIKVISLPFRRYREIQWLKGKEVALLTIKINSKLVSLTFL
ncbi:hypothetical protein KP509_39G026300 [Ceratopteris richardii]|uniref:GTD-binding domain-containing protein n=1 Tax=Ceratopteris richardii TaxID=49495 RepID=A0A8T2PZX6_CERRI|nr:hypothetical protein KP509_39G026300 [Ceratopteris richardii]